MSNEALCEVAKNAIEKICFQISEYRGHTFGDIRVYYKDDLTGELRPTKKGICISPAIWPEFAEGVERLGQELEAQGLLEPESEGEEEG